MSVHLLLPPAFGTSWTFTHSSQMYQFWCETRNNFPPVNYFPIDSAKGRQVWMMVDPRTSEQVLRPHNISRSMHENHVIDTRFRLGGGSCPRRRYQRPRQWWRPRGSCWSLCLLTRGLKGFTVIGFPPGANLWRQFHSLVSTHHRTKLEKADLYPHWNSLRYMRRVKMSLSRSLISHYFSVNSWKLWLCYEASVDLDTLEARCMFWVSDQKGCSS